MPPTVRSARFASVLSDFMTLPAMPRRTDLTRRSTRLAAALLLAILRMHEGVKARLILDVAAPGDDAFYNPPEDLHSYAPGAVIDSRPVDIRLFRRTIQVDAWHVKFRTTTSDGTPAAGVATVMRSRHRTNDRKRAVLAYQPAIDSLSPAGDPSYTLRRGDHLELPVMLLAVRRGWVVIAVDWTGPQHSFVDLALAARFVLDGMRAALNFVPAALDPAAPVGLWGYSGAHWRHSSQRSSIRSTHPS